MLKLFLPIVFLCVHGCTAIASNLNKNGLSVEIDRSTEPEGSQTYINIKSKDNNIYCLSSTEIARLHFEMSDNDSNEKFFSDKNVNWMRGVDITEPIYFVDDVGLGIFVDNFDKPEYFKIYYYQCKDLLDNTISESSIERTLIVK